MRFVYSKKAQKQFCKLDIATQKRIKSFTDALQSLENPRSRGKALIGNFSGFWRYRVGDYRIICEILDEKLVIMPFILPTEAKFINNQLNVFFDIRHYQSQILPVPLDKH